MADIIHLTKIREEGALRDGFSSWCRHFGRSFAGQTRLKDLDHTILRQLTQPGDTGTRLMNDLVIGLLGLGSHGFEDLDQRQQSRVIDLQLFLADQLHFEMMRRLGWLEGYGGQDDPLFDMLRRFDADRRHYRALPPTLSPAFPDYRDYAALIDRDKQVFIRRLIPRALQAFSQEFAHE
jgi:hypothetical protein